MRHANVRDKLLCEQEIKPANFYFFGYSLRAI